jgi:hypothetical protein
MQNFVRGQFDLSRIKALKSGSSWLSLQHALLGKLYCSSSAAASSATRVLMVADQLYRLFPTNIFVCGLVHGWRLSVSPAVKVLLWKSDLATLT